MGAEHCALVDVKHSFTMYNLKAFTIETHCFIVPLLCVETIMPQCILFQSSSGFLLNVSKEIEAVLLC